MIFWCKHKRIKKKTLILKDCAPHCSEHHTREDAAGGSLLAPRCHGGRTVGPDGRLHARWTVLQDQRGWDTALRVSVKQACAVSPREMCPRSSRLLTANTTLGKGPDRKRSRPSVLGTPSKVCQVQGTHGGVSPNHSYYHISTLHVRKQG